MLDGKANEQGSYRSSRERGKGFSAAFGGRAFRRFARRVQVRSAILQPDSGLKNVAPRTAIPPSNRTADDPDRLRSGDLSGAHPPSPPGAPLYPPHPCRDSRSHPHHAATRQRPRGQGVRAEARRLDRGTAAPPAGSSPFADGTVLPLRGVQHRIVHRPGVRGTVWTEAGGEGEAMLCVAGQAPHIDRRVSDYLRREALRDLEVSSRRAAEQLGVAIKRISVRDQSSRWGSCSTTGCCRTPGV